MIYYSILDRPRDFEPTAAGEELAPIYERVDDENGSYHLVQTGTRDVQKQIDSSRPPAMADVLKHALRGDLSFMTNQNGFYSSGDEPHDLGEAFMLSQAGFAAAQKYKDAIAKESEVISNAVNNESAGQ